MPAPTAVPDADTAAATDASTSIAAEELMLWQPPFIDIAIGLHVKKTRSLINLHLFKISHLFYDFKHFEQLNLMAFNHLVIFKAKNKWI